MTSLLMSSPPISILHWLFRKRYSNSKFLVASSPSIFGPLPPKRPGELARRLWIPYSGTWFRIKWNSDSGFQSLAVFWIPRAEFRIPMPTVPPFPGFQNPGYFQWGEVYRWVYLRWIYMDLTWQPVTFSAELSSGVSWMELTNKTCNILQTGKKTVLGWRLSMVTMKGMNLVNDHAKFHLVIASFILTIGLLNHRKYCL